MVMHLDPPDAISQLDGSSLKIQDG